MNDSTTPQDDAAMSPASDGSVGEPMAFAVTQPDSYVVVLSLHSAFAMRDMCGGGEIVPLYRQPQPTLTDAERAAIRWAEGQARLFPEFEAIRGHTEALRGLLGRMG